MAGIIGGVENFRAQIQIGPAETYNKNEERDIPNSHSKFETNFPPLSLSLQDAIGKHTLESCAYLAQTMLSQSCTGLSPLPDHQDALFPAMPPGGGGTAPPHYHHPGLGPMVQGHFGYGPQPHSQSPPSMEAPESAVSSSGIPYTPQPSPAKQQQQHAEFHAAGSPIKGGGRVPGSPAGSAYGSSPMRYPGTPPPPKDSGYILPSPAKQLFPSETGGNAAGYPSSQYPSSYNGHQSDHNQMQGYGYGHYQQSASGQPSSSTAAAAASYGNQYGNLV